MGQPKGPIACKHYNSPLRNVSHTKRSRELGIPCPGEIVYGFDRSQVPLDNEGVRTAFSAGRVMALPAWLAGDGPRRSSSTLQDYLYSIEESRLRGTEVVLNHTSYHLPCAVCFSFPRGLRRYVLLL
jgi:hypothetical protein